MIKSTQLWVKKCNCREMNTGIAGSTLLTTKEEAALESKITCSSNSDQIYTKKS